MKKLFSVILLVAAMSTVSIASYASPCDECDGGYVRKTRTTSTKRYGRVTDPDGYTNIRKGPSTNYPIVRRYYSGEYLYYVPQKSGWSKVYSGVSNSTYMGYMHTSRIKRVNPNR